MMDSNTKRKITLKPITQRFISEFNKLDSQGKIISKKALIADLRIKSTSTLSNILKGDQNIQPAQWNLFVQKYLIQNNSENENSGARPELTLESKLIKSLEEKLEAEKVKNETMQVNLSDIRTSVQAMLSLYERIDAYIRNNTGKDTPQVLEPKKALQKDNDGVSGK